MRWSSLVLTVLIGLTLAIPAELTTKALAVRGVYDIEIYEPQISSPVSSIDKRDTATWAGNAIMGSAVISGITCYKPSAWTNRYAEFVALPSCVLFLGIIVAEVVYSIIKQFTGHVIAGIGHEMVEHFYPGTAELSTLGHILLNYVEGGPALEVARANCSEVYCHRLWYTHETDNSTGKTTRKIHATPRDVDYNMMQAHDKGSCSDFGKTGYACQGHPQTKSGKKTLYGGYEWQVDDTKAYKSVATDDDFTFDVVQHMNYYADNNGFFKTEGIWCMDLTTTKYGGDKGTDGLFWQYYDPSQFQDLNGKHNYIKTCSKVKP